MFNTSIDRVARAERRQAALAAVANLLARKESSEPDAKRFFKNMERLTSRILESKSSPRGLPRKPKPKQSEENEDEKIAGEFEKVLWDDYGLTGVVVPDELLKECKRRLRICDPESDSRQDTEEELQFLDGLHRYRKQGSFFFATHHPLGSWAESKKVEPNEATKSKGERFWAVIIGNDRYDGSPLGGCVNDARLVNRFIETYFKVPKSHIRLLEDAPRETIIDALYDLRDNPDIRYGDNILIHYSGHGSSYDPRVYFTNPWAQVGSIEAICPVDRQDISERELNSIIFEISLFKGHNITIFFDCCHSGGALRGLGDTVRYIPPIADKEALYNMFKNANEHPRRHPDAPSLLAEDWEGDITSFVQLAACQDFQLAEEFIAPGSSKDEESTSPDRGLGFRGIIARKSRFGRFTWALVKILESRMGIDGTYASVIEKMGRLGPMQVPVAVGSRKESKLWFQE